MLCIPYCLEMLLKKCGAYCTCVGRVLICAEYNVACGYEYQRVICTSSRHVDNHGYTSNNLQIQSLYK